MKTDHAVTQGTGVIVATPSALPGSNGLAPVFNSDGTFAGWVDPTGGGGWPGVDADFNWTGVHSWVRKSSMTTDAEAVLDARFDNLTAVDLAAALADPSNNGLTVWGSGKVLIQAVAGSTALEVNYSGVAPINRGFTVVNEAGQGLAVLGNGNVIVGDSSTFICQANATVQGALTVTNGATAATFNGVALTAGGGGTLYLADDGTYKAVSGSGEANTQSNQGGFVEIGLAKSGVDLPLRTLQSSDASVIITQNADNIDLQATGAGGGEANRGENIGGLIEVYAGMNGVNLQLRTLQSSDSSVSVTQNANDIDFTATAISVGADPAGTAAAVQLNLDAHTGNAAIHFTEGSIDHAAIQNIGTNTHAQIDTHIAATNNPHSVTDVQVIGFAASDIARLSQANTFAESQTITNATDPELTLYQTGQLAESGRFAIISAGGFLLWRSETDAGVPVGTSELAIGHANNVAAQGVTVGSAAFQGAGTLNAENGLHDGGDRVISGDESTLKLINLTQAEYDALGAGRPATTLYVIND